MGRIAGVIDLFAGPGGLAEGFASFRNKTGNKPFKILLSAEKERSAHRTLELRAFFRSFGYQVPTEYYRYVRNEISKEDLFSAFSKNTARAKHETVYGPRELGRRADDQLILERIKRHRREADELIVIGGPPCQAYSVVGRARRRGMAGYRPEKDERNFLYKEYLKILAAAAPAAFVMENVKGILSSKVNGSNIFPRILEDLSRPGDKYARGPRFNIYSFTTKVDLGSLIDSDYIIRCEEQGIPQARHRVILLGIREDIRSVPPVLLPTERTYTVADVIADLPKLRSGLTEVPDEPQLWIEAIQSAARVVSHELVLAGYKGRAARKYAERSRALLSRGSKFLEADVKELKIGHFNRWFTDKRIGGYLNHEARAHMQADLERYLYCACVAKQNDGLSPRSHEMPSALAPRHRNWKSGFFMDRFKVQTSRKPSSTITSHIAKDGHYFIHYDPSQCRSLTVREAARLQTFPDNYFFEGNRTQQYGQVGNAVPPLLAQRIAEIVWKTLR